MYYIDNVIYEVFLNMAFVLQLTTAPEYVYQVQGRGLHKSDFLCGYITAASTIFPGIGIAHSFRGNYFHTTRKSVL